MASKDLLPIYHNGQLEYSSYDKAAEARKNGDEVVPLRHFKFEDGTEQFVSYEKSTAFQEQWEQEGRQATELFHAINTDNPSELITQTTEERDAAWKAESGRWGEFAADYGAAVGSQAGRIVTQIPKMIVGLSQLTNAGLGWLTSAGGLLPNAVSGQFHDWAKDNARLRQGLDQFDAKHLSADKKYDHLMSDGVRTTRDGIEVVTNLGAQLLIGGAATKGAQAVNAAATTVKGVAPVAQVVAPSTTPLTTEQMLVNAGKQVATGPGKIYAAGMAGEAAGETHAAAIENGVDPNRAAEIATMDGLTSYFLSRLDLESGAISAAAGPAASKTAKQWFLGGLLRPFKSDVAKRVMRNVAWEGGSESLDQWMHLSRLQDAGVEINTEDKIRATAQAGIFGAAGGGIGELGGYLDSRSELKKWRHLFAIEHQAEAVEALKRAAAGQPVATDAPGGPAAITQNGGVIFKDGAVVHGDGTITTVNGVVTDTEGQPITIRPEVNQQSTIDLFRLIRESDLKVQHLPVDSIAVNDRVKQFKADADAATGVVAGERLQGAYNPIPAKPILVMEFADGHREVVTGRHRLDLAKQNQMAQIPANIIYEKDGWTIESARLMDAYDNILDGKGSDQDFVNFFRNSKLDAQTLAEHPELYGRKRQAEAKLLAENASDDLYTFFMGKDERMTLDVASAIAREAPMGANAYAGDIQRAVMRAVLNDGVRATDAAIMARSLMSAYKQRIEAKGIQQLSLFGDDDSFQLAMTLEAKFASSKVREIETDLRALKQATGKQSGNLKAREALLKKYGLESSEDVEGMQRVIGELEARKVRWQNYYTNPDLAQQAHAYAKQALHLDDIAVEMPDGRMTTVNQEAGAVAATNADAETDTGDNPDQGGFDFSMMPKPKAVLQPVNDSIESRFTVENAPHFSVVSDEGLMTVDIADGATEAEINQGLKQVLSTAREAGVEVKINSHDRLTNVQREAILEHNQSTPTSIERRYVKADKSKRPGWLKATNGKVTQLSERQWTHVRSGGFKAWFGNWEALSRGAILRNAPVVKMPTGSIPYASNKRSEIKKRLTDWAKRKNFGGFYDTEIGRVQIDFHSIKTTLGHPRWGEKKLRAIYTLEEGFKHAVYINSMPDLIHGNLINHYFAYRVDDNGTPSLIFCRAQEDANKNRIYLHEFYTEAEIIKGGTVKPGAVYDALTDSATFGKIILNPLYNINPKNVSKVVDENGEPLVVYHGTGEDFKIFQHSKIGFNTKNKGIFGNGFYATDQRSLAERYAKYNRTNGKVMSLFVNMRTPFRWSDPASVEIARKLGFPESRIKNGKLLPLVEERQILDFTAKLKNAGYDGTIYTYPEGGSEYCVWDSNQFKSATDNHGGYSDANPNIDMNVADEMRSTLESTVYPNGGRVPVVGSPAAEKGRIPLALYHVVGIYRTLAGRYPKVVKDANRGPRSALGWFKGDTQDIAVRAQLFGLADATDIQALHDDLKQKGFFRNEDPNWCAHHSKRVVIHEKRLSQIKLHEALNKLVDRRIKSGIHQGIGTKVMAHELWHYIDQLDGVKVREHGNFLAHILNLKQSHAEVMPETAFTTDTELINEATNFIAWWMGIKPDQVQYHKQPKEAYAEMGAALWLDPGAVAQRAPKYYRAMMEGMQRHPSAMRAWEKAVAAIEGKTDVSGLMDRLSAQWSREAETERRRLRSRLQRVAPEGANLFERLYYRFFGANNAMKFARIFTDKHAPVVMVANEATSIALRQAEKMVKKGKLTQDEYNALKLAANAAVEDVSYLLTQYRHQYGRSKIFLADLSEKVIQASRKLDVDMKTLAKYLHLKRVIEIGDRATALGIDAPTAHKALNQMSRELGLSKMRNVISMANQFRAVYEQAVINNAQVASMLGPDNMRILQRNKHYVTMRHVDDAGQIVDMHEQLDQKGKAGRDPLTLALTQMMRIGGGISTETGYRLHRLTGSFRATSNPVTATAETAVAIIEAAQKNAMMIELADTLEQFEFPEFRILEKGENEVNNDRFGTVHFMKNGEVKAMVVPREVADAVMDKSSSIPGITTFCRFINAGRTTNNITFIAPAYERDLAAFAINNKGFKRSPLHWLSAFNLGTAMRLIPGKPGAVLGGITDAGAYVAMAAQFIPPHVMKSIGKHPLGRFLFNTSTVEYWTSFGHKMARMIQRGEFEQTLQEAKAAREAGNLSKAEELEYCAVMARKALEDGVLLTMRQMRNDDFVKSDLKQLFDKYNISFEDDVDTMAPLPERVWKVLKDPKQWGTAAWQSASKSAHGIWEGIGNMSEIEEMTVKLAGYCALHNQATGGKQQFSDKDRKRIALQTTEMVGSPDFAARGLLAQMIEMSTSSFWNARLRAGLRSVKSATRHPGSWFGKATLHALPTLTSLMVTSGLLRRSLVWLLTDDNDEEKLKGTVAGSVIDALRWQEEAMKKVSVYAQRAYRCLPIWFDGLTTICLKLPIPDEAKLIDMGIRATWNKFAKKCGLGSPDPGVEFDHVVHEAANQFGFDPSDRGSIWSFLTPFVSPYLFGSNPHESYRDAPMYSERDFKARFLEPANFAEKVTHKTWNASPFAQLYRFRESDGGPHSDSTKELRFILNFPVVGPTLARFCSVDSGGDMQTLREYEKIDEAQRAADRIKVEQLFLKMEAQEELSAEDTLFLLQNTDRLKQLFKEAKKPSALRKLESIKSIKDPDTRLRAIDAINAN